MSPRLRSAALALAVFVCAGAAYAQDAARTTVQAAARDWLALIDRGDAGASWDAAAAKFRAAIAREPWIGASAKVRAPFGKVTQRAVFSTGFGRTFPGAPEGEYAFVVFRTSFARRSDTQETVTLEREPDGVWRVVGYTAR
jgi:hypothetical protein